ncbi:MAG: dienelactone hydrolase family protein [Alphaproteobacteria bacterium]|jgi:carboxymethylenebutenolidase|nr:carboxymethylenebutenolidase [Rhodospirillaceae bacterium]MDP6023216.1 dienelactone hydrolase family protein [Alphaproteobacteria bacterium]MDP6256794.1 dienelactone hydrolase family protein [Alphaproteobacteria bacterium]MDP7229036.1 dienelactone hydrolase family protein [Alphaproteobacteria bacterium]MDP7461232.1 dienelactone hydrolase family protein [Alphaproteobacteria bacterium]|tara:strand:- start:4289 stop:4984 length:696 start_codon:yes stop_codon:yes gene_type:complete
MGQDIEINATGGGAFAAYLALPESTPAPGIVLLPEVFNTNDHIRSVADGFAAEGFTVIAPDVYWRQEAGCYLPYTDEGRAKAQALRAKLDTDQFANDLGDTVTALKARSECAGKVGVVGFCLGGKFTYLSATRHEIDAAVSYYGVQIHEYLDEARNLHCPILMHFAGIDPHVPQDTVDAIQAHMGAWENVDIHLYPGAEHGFNRHGHPPYSEAAADPAMQRTLAHFHRLLG